MRAIVDLCMRRRAAATSGMEEKPLVLCVISRESVLKDGAVMTSAQSIDQYVQADDLNITQTASFVEHLCAPQGRRGSRSAHSHKRRSVEEASDPATSSERHGLDILSQYVQNMTGGNIYCIMALVLEMETQKFLVRDETTGQMSLSKTCGDLNVLQEMVKPPQNLVGMAFSTFERLDPREQTVLKTASTFDGNFSQRELLSGLPGFTDADLQIMVRKLCTSQWRALRFVPSDSNTVEEDPTEKLDSRFEFYSGLLRIAASTLVLESQRTEVRRMTLAHSHADIEKLNLLNLMRDLEEEDNEESSSNEEEEDARGG